MPLDTSFEYFLRNKHGEDYHGLDDDMPDAFEDWLCDLEQEELMDYAQEYGDERYNEGRN